MVDEDGELVEAYSYGAWGEVAASVQLGAGVGYTFTGQEEDTESGLMNYRARLYDPALGRFLGVDPAGQFASPYLYAGNNPVSLTDPTGEFAGLDDLVVGGLAFAGGYLSHGITQGDWGWSAVRTGAVSAVGALAAYNTGGLASGLVLSAGGGTGTAAITGSAIGGAAGGFASSVAGQGLSGQPIDFAAAGRSAAAGFGAGLAAGAVGYGVGMLGRYPMYHSVRHVAQSTAGQIGANVFSGRNAFSGLDYGLNPYLAFPLMGDAVYTTSPMWTPRLRDWYIKNVAGVPPVRDQNGNAITYKDGSTLYGHKYEGQENAVYFIDSEINIRLDFDLGMVVNRGEYSFGHAQVSGRALVSPHGAPDGIMGYFNINAYYFPFSGHRLIGSHQYVDNYFYTRLNYWTSP